MISTIEKIEAEAAEFLKQIAKVKAMGHGWKAEAKRARKRSLEIEKLMKEFRKTSVGEAAAKE